MPEDKESLNEQLQPNDRVQVLVVEDTLDDARMTVRALSKLSPPPSVRLVKDGAEALEYLLGQSEEPPALVFLDLKLPKVHGLEVLRRIKHDPKTRHVKVVVLTSSDEPSDIETARKLGAAEYICKPMAYDQYMLQICECAAKYIKSCFCVL